MRSKGNGKSPQRPSDRHVIEPLQPAWAIPPKAQCQKVLFSGMDCAEGQLDLFSTDGEDSEELEGERQ